MVMSFLGPKINLSGLISPFTSFINKLKRPFSSIKLMKQTMETFLMYLYEMFEKEIHKYFYISYTGTEKDRVKKRKELFGMVVDNVKAQKNKEIEVLKEKLEYEMNRKDMFYEKYQRYKRAYNRVKKVIEDEPKHEKLTLSFSDRNKFEDSCKELVLQLETTKTPDFFLVDFKRKIIDLKTNRTICCQNTPIMEESFEKKTELKIEELKEEKEEEEESDELESELRIEKICLLCCTNPTEWKDLEPKKDCPTCKGTGDTYYLRGVLSDSTNCKEYALQNCPDCIGEEGGYYEDYCDDCKKNISVLF